MKPVQDFFIHVSPGGDDADPGTDKKPVQTLNRAMELLPCCYYGACQVILAPGTYAVGAPINCFLPKPVGPAATDFAIIGAMTNVFGNRTCTANDPTGLVYADTGLGVSGIAANAFVGATLECVATAHPAPNNLGANRMVVSNTATAFTVNVPWPVLPVIGDQFAVLQPAVTISHTGLNFWGPAPIVALRHLKFVYVGTDQTALFAAFLVKFAAESVDMHLGGKAFALLHHCGIIAGAELATLTSPKIFDAARLADWYIHEGSLTLTNRCQIPNSNNLVTADLSIACAESSFTPRSIFGTNTDISLTTYSTFNHGGIPAHRSSLAGSNASHPFLVKADKNSIVGGGNAGLQNLDLAGSPGHAIVLQGNSHGYIGNVTGAGNVGYGISCTQMSTACVNVPVATSVAGVLGDTLVGTVPR